MTVRPRMAATSSGLRTESSASNTALSVVFGLCEPSTLARTSFIPASLQIAAIYATAQHTRSREEEHSPSC